MSDKVFWGILGTILVGWIVVYFVLVSGRADTFAQLSKELKTQTQAMKKYASIAEDEPARLPTDKLRRAKESFIAKYGSNCDEAEDVYRQRDRLFESDTDKSLADWRGSYLDQFRLLEERYRAHTNLDPAKDLPFAQEKSIVQQGLVPVYQKNWVVEKTVVEAVLKYPGSSLMVFSDQRRKDAKALERFDRLSYRVEAKIPPTKVADFLSSLLGHGFINFEVASIHVLKSERDLKFASVEEVPEGGVPGDEPMVNVVMDLDVLDWKEGEAKE